MILIVKSLDGEKKKKTGTISVLRSSARPPCSRVVDGELKNQVHHNLIFFSCLKYVNFIDVPEWCNECVFENITSMAPLREFHIEKNSRTINFLWRSIKSIFIVLGVYNFANHSVIHSKVLLWLMTMRQRLILSIICVIIWSQLDFRQNSGKHFWRILGGKLNVFNFINNSSWVRLGHSIHILTLKDAGGGGGSKCPYGFSIGCHFSQDLAMVTKILDFIHKHHK